MILLSMARFSHWIDETSELSVLKNGNEHTHLTSYLITPLHPSEVLLELFRRANTQGGL